LIDNVDFDDVDFVFFILLYSLFFVKNHFNLDSSFSRISCFCLDMWSHFWYMTVGLDFLIMSPPPCQRV